MADELLGEGIAGDGDPRVFAKLVGGSVFDWEVDVKAEEQSNESHA